MSQSLSPHQWQPADSSGNHPGFAGFDLAQLDAAQLAAFTHSKALTEALRHDPRTDDQIARQVSISKGHLSKLRSGLWQEQAGRMAALLMEVGHVGPIQKLLYDLGFDVKRRKVKAKRVVS